MDNYDSLTLLTFNKATFISLFSAISLASQSPVQLHFTSISSPDSLSQAIHSAANHAQISFHPNIRSLYEHFQYRDQEGSEFYVLSLELCHHSFAELIEAHVEAGSKVKERDLWRMLKESVEALQFAQRKVRSMQGIAHRNLNPRSVYVGEDGKVRVGDWNYSVAFEETKELGASLAGEPQFMSPELRQFLILQSRTPTPLHILHNPFKSDLFSLGYTFLILSLLRDSKCGRVLNGIAVNIANEISKLSDYSVQWRTAIRVMMDPDAASRPDFNTFFDLVTIPVEEPPEELVICVLGEHKRKEERGERIVMGCRHEFCSKSCLCDYVYGETKGYGGELGEVGCPNCKEKIGEKVIVDAFGGAEEFETQRSMLVQGCVTCNREAYTWKRFLCNHRICDFDFKRLSKPRHCPYPDCGSEADPAFKRENCALF